ADIGVVKATTASTITSIGQAVPYTFTVTNTGGVTLQGITVADPLIDAVDCPAAPLAPGASMVCTGSYASTAADFDAGEVVNVATVSGSSTDAVPVASTSNEVKVPTVPSPAMTITKATTVTSFDAPGVVVPYTFTVTNTGTVTLTGVAVTDPMLGPARRAAGVLAPGAATSCTGSYTTTAADLDAGEVVNVADAA